MKSHPKTAARASRRNSPSLRLIAGWAVLAGFYVCLSWKLDPPELASAAVCGGLAAAAWVAIWERPGRSFSFRPAWFRRLARMLRQVVADIVVVAAGLLRGFVGPAPHGRILAVKIVEPGDGEHDSAEEDAGLRVMTIAGISLAPNTYAMDIRDDGCVMLHQLIRTDVGISGARNPRP